MAALRDKDVNIVEVVSDAHMQISSIMSKFHQIQKGGENKENDDS